MIVVNWLMYQRIGPHIVQSPTLLRIMGLWVPGNMYLLFCSCKMLTYMILNAKMEFSAGSRMIKVEVLCRLTSTWGPGSLAGPDIDVGKRTSGH